MIRKIIIILLTILMLINKTNPTVLNAIFVFVSDWGSGNEPLLQDILLNYIAYLPNMLRDVVLAIGVFMITKKTIGDSMFYALLTLAHGWLGMILVPLIMVTNDNKIEAKTIRQVFIWLIIGVFVQVANPFLMQLTIPLIVNHYMDTIQYAPYFYTAFNFTLYLLIGILIAFSFHKFIQQKNQKSTIWVILALLSGLVPWIIFCALNLMKRERNESVEV